MEYLDILDKINKYKLMNNKIVIGGAIAVALLGLGYSHYRTIIQNQK